MASGSDKRQREKVIPVRCSEPEFLFIHAKADQAGLFAGGYLRALALGSPGPRALRRPPVDRKELARLLGEIGRVGNNLNQIARAFNMDNRPPPQELTAALESFSELRGLVRRALGVQD